MIKISLNPCFVHSDFSVAARQGACSTVALRDVKPVGGGVLQRAAADASCRTVTEHAGSVHREIEQRSADGRATATDESAAVVLHRRSANGSRRGVGFKWQYLTQEVNQWGY